MDITSKLKKKTYKKEKLTTIDGVSGKVKKFDSYLHSKYDINAREMLKSVLGNSIIDNDDKYGEDMIFTVKQFPYKYLEVQVFSNWCTKDFPYSYPFVYSRKMRFSKNTLFVTFNKFLTEIIIFGKNSIDVKPSKLKKYDRECVNFVGWNKSLRIETENLTLKAIRIYSGESIDSSSEESIDSSLEDN